MMRKIYRNLYVGTVTLVTAFLIAPVTGTADDAADLVADALSAAWPRYG